LEDVGIILSSLNVLDQTLHPLEETVNFLSHLHEFSYYLSDPSTFHILHVPHMWHDHSFIEDDSEFEHFVNHFGRIFGDILTDPYWLIFEFLRWPHMPLQNSRH
jgi:hypothetical protein